jgi:Tfp pilus assembly protein PilO
VTDAKVLRFAAVVVVLAAYAFIFRAGEARIAERLDENARIAERVRAGERTLASRPRVEARRTRLRAGLRTVELGADRSTLVARFLRDAARIAAAHHATIPAITATGPQIAATAPHIAATGQQNPASPESTASAEPLEAIPLELTVEGRYADVLATMRALSRSRVLAAVDVASLARKHADGADATLSAALHVALERLAPSEPEPVTEPAPPLVNADVRTRHG